MTSRYAFILIFDDFELLATLCLQQFEQDLCRMVGKCMQCDVLIIEGFQHVVEQRFSPNRREIVGDVDRANNGFDYI